MSSVNDLGLPVLPANQFWRISERSVELCERVPQGKWEAVPSLQRYGMYEKVKPHPAKSTHLINGRNLAAEHRCTPVELTLDAGKKDRALRPVKRIVLDLRCEERLDAHSVVLASEPEGCPLVSKANVSQRCRSLLAEVAAEKEAAELVGEYPPLTEEVAA